MTSAELLYICGFKSCHIGNLLFVDDVTLIYLAGTVCVIHSIETNYQRFLEIEDLGEINLLRLSHCRRFFGIGCKGTGEGNGPAIHVYDMAVLRRRKTVTCPEIEAEVYSYLDFSQDVKLLVALSGPPQYSLVLWQWEKGRILTIFHPGNLHPNSEVYQVLFSPEDSNNVYTVGKFNFRLYRLTDNIYKQMNFIKFEYYHQYQCMCWLSRNVMAVGTHNGLIHIYEGPDVKQEIKLYELDEGEGMAAPAGDSPSMGTKLKEGPDEEGGVEEGKEDEKTSEEDEAKKQARLKKLQKKEYPVIIIEAAKNGMVCLHGPEQVIMFELFENKFYKYIRTVTLPVDDDVLFTTLEEDKPQVEEIIIWIALSPDLEILACVTNLRRIMTFYISHANIFTQPVFNPLPHPQHSNGIRCIDICTRKHLVTTCSSDCILYIWDYNNGNMEFTRKYPVQIYSVALHPSGMYILIGFADKLAYCTILMDDVRQVRSFPIKQCLTSCFSNGGHIFAAVADLVVNVYSDITLENIATLKGHYGQITAVRFSLDDLIFYTCGKDGAVYEWNVFGSIRINENVMKTCQYKDITLSPDGKVAYCIGSDRTVKEISKSVVEKQHDFPNIEMTCIHLSKRGEFCIIGTNKGVLLGAKFPISYASRFQHFSAHSKGITKLRLTYMEHILLTSGEDGCLCVWKLVDKDAPSKKEKEDHPITEEILFTRKELLEGKEKIQQLDRRVKEINSEMEYNMRLKDMFHTQYVRSLSDKYETELHELNTKIAALQEERRGLESKYQEKLLKQKEDHENEMQEEDSIYRQKLLDEYNRYDNLKAEYHEAKREFEETLKRVEETHQEKYSSMVAEYENRLKKLNQEKARATKEVLRIKEENREWQEQVEEDMDFEILDIKTTFEKQLKEERDAKASLKGEATLLVKKLNNMKREIDELQTNIRKFHVEENKLQTVIKNLEKDIFLLKKEISERDQVIIEKENTIHSLRRDIQQVEKHNYVLKFNLIEVEKQLKPKERENVALRSQIHNVESELTKFHYANKNFKRTIKELQTKVTTSEKTSKKEKDKSFRLEIILNRFRADLYLLCGLIQEPKKLVDCVIQLQKKHLQETRMEKILGAKTQDQSLENELIRHRQHLERSVAALRRKLRLDTETHQSDYVRLLQENSELVKEINLVRKEMQHARSAMIDMESLLGLSAGIGDNRMRLEEIMVISKEKDSVHKAEIAELENIIHLQSAEIQKLQGQLLILQQKLAKAEAAAENAYRPGHPRSVFRGISQVTTSS